MIAVRALDTVCERLERQEMVRRGSRWIVCGIALALVVLIGVAAWPTTPRRSSRLSPEESIVQRARLEQSLAWIRANPPSPDVDSVPAPALPQFWTAETRVAWSDDLERSKPWLAAFDELHDDASLRALLLEIGEPPPTAPPKMLESRWWANVLIARAVIASDEGLGDEAARRLAQVLDIALLFRANDGWGWGMQSILVHLAVDGFQSCAADVGWDAGLAWNEIRPRLDALLADGRAHSEPSAALAREINARWEALRAGDYDLRPSRLGFVEGEERTVRQAQRRARLFKLALAADRFRASAGRWPTSTEELSDLLEPSDLEDPVTGDALELHVSAAGLRVDAPLAPGETRRPGTVEISIAR